MVSQTCCHHADSRGLYSIAELVRSFVVGSVFISPLALAIDLGDLRFGPLRAVLYQTRNRTGTSNNMLRSVPIQARRSDWSEA